jgi:arylformamidase
MPVMDGISPPSFVDLATVAQDGYAMSEYRFVNHVGTHVDAPSHMIAGGATLDEIPMEQMVTDAVIIDAEDQPPGLVGLDHLGRHLDRVHAGDIVLFRSGNDRNWGTDAYWRGWCYPDGAAIKALIERGVVGVGFDGPSADPVESVSYDLHRLWLSAGAIIIENLCGLSALPDRCRIVVAPLKVRASNGGPARVFAFP